MLSAIESQPPVEGKSDDKGDVKMEKLRETELDVEEATGLGGIDDGLLTPAARPPVTKKTDINLYQQRKTLAQGMMDVALLTANANQLRIALEQDDDSYYIASVTLISLSIILQIAIGVCLIWNGSYNVNKRTQLIKANRVNNIIVIGIFFITVINVFISAFGITTEVIIKQNKIVPKPTTNLISGSIP